MVEEKHRETGREAEGEFRIRSSHVTYALVLVLVAVLAFNQFQLFQADAGLRTASALASIRVASGAAQSQGVTLASDASVAALAAQLMPTGIPAVYGPELGVSYSDPVKSLGVLASFDTSLSLQGEALQRYIAVTTQISCEYCCGAEAITFPNGQAACGCQHSAGMRGLAKYLFANHAGEFTNEQVMEEVAKWKMLFFPRDSVAKAAALQAKGIELTYSNIGSNAYRGVTLEGSSGAASGGGLAGQVGGC